MKWQEVCDDPVLRDLPYKIELNEWGQIVMSPASNRHGALQMLIGQLLGQQAKGGLLIAECAVQTEKGVLVADVAWCSDAFVQKHGLDTPYSLAPDLCVEILSPSNTRTEMDQKCALYLKSGAREVWLCDDAGELQIIGHEGIQAGSMLFPSIHRIPLRGFH